MQRRNFLLTLSRMSIKPNVLTAGLADVEKVWLDSHDAAKEMKRGKMYAGSGTNTVVALGFM
jgi:hypothetical protein